MVRSLLSRIVYDWRLYATRYDKINDQLRRTYYEVSSQGKIPHNNTLIFMQDDRILKGGLADRLRGMISMYAYCKEYNMVFKILHNHPFNLEDYLEPNFYDWRIAKDDVCYSSDVALPVLMCCATVRFHATVEQEVSFMKWYLTKFIRKNKHKEYHLYTNARFVSSLQYAQYFHELFKPTKKMLEALNEERRKIGGKYISITLRFQNLLGDFYEGEYPTLSEDEQKTLIKKVIKKIESIYHSYNKELKLLVTADSRKFLDVVENMPYVYTIQGNMVHMSYTSKTDFQTHLKSFLDFLMLANAEKLYLLVTDNMYRSGFARSASYINNKPYEEIVF